MFDGLSAELFRETSTAFGEQFVHRPMRQRTNKTPVVDETRPVTCFVGQMRQPYHGEHMGRSRKQARPDVSSSQPSILCLLCDFSDPPRQDDVIERVNPQAAFDVSDVRPDGHGRVRLTLLERGVRSLASVSH